MKFVLKEPKIGDMIRIKVGSIYHYGVFCSEEQVVQFGFAPNLRPNVKDSEVEVCVGSIQEFTQEGFVEVAQLDKKELKKRIKPKKTVELALSKLGEKGYNIIYNNCEHLAYECVFGEKKCTQADDLRAFFRSLPVINVFIAPIKETIDGEVYPTQRQLELDKVTNEVVKREKYSSWKLLEYAISRSFGFKFADLVFAKEKGKWVCDKCYFSISHSDGYVAVAVSREACGVDIENREVADNLARLVLTKKETAEFNNLQDKSGYMLNKWVLKESIFKSLGQKNFAPKKIETDTYSTFYKQIEVGEKTFSLGVATNTPDKIKLFLDVKY